MRKLASVRQVAALEPIENADNIELARIDGWKVIVQKGIYEVGDSVVFFEIDSVLPIRDEFEFLRDRCYVVNPVEGFRLKTMKMRGVVSQGLVIPCNESWDIGTDVTEHYGVKLYEPTVKESWSKSNGSLGFWPHSISKTDQERVQNIQVPQETYEVTVKLDGSSATVYYNDGQIGVCSRNWALCEGGMFWDAAEKIIEVLKSLKKNIAVQGELMGPKVQGNKLGLSKHQIFVFDIWDIDNQRYLSPSERLELNRSSHKTMDEVHWFGWYTPTPGSSNEEIQNELLEMADSKMNNKPIEGLVFKSLESETSFKVINNKYLLKEN
jgi:RNA ligase (TIGR02306 family)